MKTRHCNFQTSPTHPPSIQIVDSMRPHMLDPGSSLVNLLGVVRLQSGIDIDCEQPQATINNRMFFSMIPSDGISLFT